MEKKVSNCKKRLILNFEKHLILSGEFKKKLNENKNISHVNTDEMGRSILTGQSMIL
jgi:hypothetical protein